MKTTNDLLSEAQAIATYLLGRRPNARVVAQYVDAMQFNPGKLDEQDRRLLVYGMKHHSLLGCIEAGLALAKPYSELRRKYYVMVAILESDPAYARLFLPQKRSPLYVIVIGLAGVRVVFKAVAGLVILKVVR